MSDGKVSNRWLVVFGAILIQLALGAIYAWSVFTPSLQKAPYNFNNTQTQAIFTAGLFTFALVMIFAGIRMKKGASPRSLSMLGGIVLGSGYILAGLFGSTFFMQILCIGIIGGAGIGFAYVVPIAVGMKWFPDKKGLVSGLAVAGFGFGATIWVKVGGSWFGLVENLGVQSVFMYYGITFIIMTLIGSIWMVNPPEGYVPEGYSPQTGGAGGDKKAVVPVDVTWQKMLTRTSFWTIWLMFVFGGMAGLTVIGNIARFGLDVLKSASVSESAAKTAAGTAMAWYAIFNGLGRIVWGKILDVVGSKMALFMLFFVQGFLMLSLYKMGVTAVMLAVFASAIGFNYGGTFALFPAATAQLFGAKNVGSNYPFVFTAYGIGGIVGPLLAGFIRDTYGSFLMAFVPAGIVCLVGSVLALTLKPPKN